MFAFSIDTSRRNLSAKPAEIASKRGGLQRGLTEHEFVAVDVRHVLVRVDRDENVARVGIDVVAQVAAAQVPQQGGVVQVHQLRVVVN